MRQSTLASQANIAGICKSPGFSSQERDMITAWAETLSVRGLRIEITSAHQFLDESLYVMLGSTDDTGWLIHKTPEGTVAVRLWPGLADIVPTVTDALAVITEAVGRQH